MYGGAVSSRIENQKAKVFPTAKKPSNLVTDYQPKVNTKPNIINDNDNNNNITLKTNLSKPLNKDEPLKISSNLRIGIKNSDKPVIAINNLSN